MERFKKRIILLADIVMDYMQWSCCFHNFKSYTINRLVLIEGKNVFQMVPTFYRYLYAASSKDILSSFHYH